MTQMLTCTICGSRFEAAGADAVHQCKGITPAMREQMELARKRLEAENRAIAARRCDVCGEKLGVVQLSHGRLANPQHECHGPKPGSRLAEAYKNPEYDPRLANIDLAVEQAVAKALSQQKANAES